MNRTYEMMMTLLFIKLLHHLFENVQRHIVFQKEKKTTRRVGARPACYAVAQVRKKKRSRCHDPVRPHQHYAIKKKVMAQYKLLE